MADAFGTVVVVVVVDEVLDDVVVVLLEVVLVVELLVVEELVVVERGGLRADASGTSDVITTTLTAMAASATRIHKYRDGFIPAPRRYFVTQW